MQKLKIRWIVLIITALFTLSAPIQAQDAQAWDLLGLVNAARNAAGIHSLTMNPQLVAAAQRHSDDMALGDFLSHTGSDGSQFWQRMNDAGYNMSSGAENILYRWDLSATGAFDQWWNSTGHRNNMMNADYVEIGIAWTLSDSGSYYYTMVLGARPGVEPPAIEPPTPIPPTPIPPTPIPPTPIPPTPIPPTPIPPTPIPPTPLPLPSDTPVPTWTPMPTWTFVPTWTSIPTWTSVPTAESGMPTVVPPPTWTLIPTWTLVPTVVSPPTWTPVPLASPTQTVESSVSQTTEVAALPPSEGTGKDEELMAGQVNVERLIARVLAVVLDELIRTVYGVVPDTPPDVVQVVPTSVPPQPDILLILPDIRLVYNADNVTLINVSGYNLDLTGLVFEGSSGTMLAERWDTEFLSRPLNNFPAGDCLQVWGLGSQDVRPQPGECRFRQVWVSVNETQQFWVNTERFSVSRGGVVLEVCEMWIGACDVSLYGGTPVDNVVPTSAPPVDVGGPADIRLIYDAESLALVNVSGHVLDLTALAFESDSGVMSASRWNTEFLSRPLNAFPTGDCLQVWGLEMVNLPVKPDECEYRHAWIAVGDEARFWVNIATFRARRGAELLATCEVWAGVCDVHFP